MLGVVLLHRDRGRDHEPRGRHRLRVPRPAGALRVSATPRDAAARRPRPHRPLPDARRRRAGRLRPLVLAAPRRDARRRRRVRLGQERHEPRDHGPAQPQRTRTSAARSLFEGRDLLALPPDELRKIRGKRHRDDLPGPVRVPAPDVPRRRPDRRGGARARERLATSRRERAPSSCSAQVGIPNARVARARLPAPVLGRHAPARDDRDGARAQPGRADRRRADDRARRDRAGADPRADRPASRRSSTSA